MIYIHGGAFSVGNGNDNLYGPDFLIEKNVIVVTMNYRLGVFGFLSFDNPEYSGNMGLKDQQLALQWLHENIGQFNGDNKRMTIMGGSAGSVSTHFHVLESREYFRNAITMAGVTDNFWAISKKEKYINLIHRIAKDFNSPQNSSHGFIQLLKSIPAEELVDYGDFFSFFQRTLVTPLSPVIES